MPNSVLTQTLKDSKPENFYPDEKLKKIQESLESESLKNELQELKSVIVYNAFNVETLMSKCSGLINSLLEKRDELKSLEVLLLNQALARILRAKSNQNDECIEKIQFENIDFLSKSLSKSMELKIEENKVTSESKSAEKILNLETELYNVKKLYRRAINEINEVFDEFSSKEDSGLNYLDRYLEKKEIYQFLFKELYKYLLSLEEGFKSVYKINTNLPNLDSTNLLNDFHSWFRINLLELEKITQYEQEFDLIISLTNGVSDKKGLIAGSDNPTFNAQRNVGLIDFKLPTQLLDKKFVRLRGINVAMILSDKANMNKPPFDSEIYPVEIKLPNQKDSKGKVISLPTIRVNATNYFKYQNDFQVSNSVLININPFADNWQITIPVKGASNFEENIGRGAIADMFLILKLAYTD